MKYSVIFPSRSFENTDFTLRSILENSVNVDEVIIIWDSPTTLVHALDRYSFQGKVLVVPNQCSDVYGMFNKGVSLARTDYVLLVNDDMYFPKGWDEGLDMAAFDYPITFVLVEPGFVEVSPKNILNNFGMTIEEFKQDEFEHFAETYRAFNTGIIERLGWYMPVLFPKNIFNKYGQYPTQPPFPHPNDITFFEHLASNGIRFMQLQSVVYHFQRLSQRGSTKKLNLCCGDDIREGYENVDKINFDLSNGKLPYNSNEYDEILFAHALEHFRAEVGVSILREIYRSLKPGGMLEIYVPDLSSAVEEIYLAQSPPDRAPAMQRIYGQNYSEERVHKWGYTSESLLEVLMEVGFVNYDFVKRYPDEIGYKVWK